MFDAGQKTRKNKMSKILILLTVIVGGTALDAAAQVTQGGTYKMEQSVIASGGGTSSDGGNFSITGTIGQAAAGNIGNPPYALQSGFHTVAPLTPTAAPATIGGRVLTDGGRGIRNVIVTLTDSKGESRSAVSSAFGYYRFSDIAVGEVYILSAKAKQFQFEQNNLVISVSENLLELNFIALPK